MDTPVLSSVFSGSGPYLPESVSADRASVCHLTYKSSLFELPALVNNHDYRVSLDSGASENSFHRRSPPSRVLRPCPLRQSFTVRAAKGSPLTVNTFVCALLRYEGVQLHLGLRVVNFFFSTFVWDIPSYKNTIPLLIGLRKACACTNGIVLIL